MLIIVTEFQISDMNRIISTSLQYLLVAHKISKVRHRPQGTQLVSGKGGENATPACDSQSRVLCPTPCHHLLHHAISQ